MNYVLISGVLINLDSICFVEKEMIYEEFCIVLTYTNNNFVFKYNTSRERDEIFECIKTKVLCKESYGLCL